MQNLKLPARPGFLLQDYAKQLEGIFGSGLISLIVYGSAASGEFIDEHSDVNLLVVLDDDSLANLEKVSVLVNQKKFSRFIPVFFTQNYIKASSDVFPIEFLDMQENYALIFGKDVLQVLIKNCSSALRSVRFFK